jgi:hypothetical protein
VPIRIAVIALAALSIIGVGAPRAAAQALGDMVFEGTHEAGGTIRFTVDPSGTVIQALELEGIAGGGCSWDTIDLGNWGGEIEIAGAGFQATNADNDTFQGRLLTPLFAEGTVTVSDPAQGCSTPDLRWVASAAGHPVTP